MLTGSGTELDPLKVTTANEFVEAWKYQLDVNNTTDKTAVYIELENDIDFNDSDYYYVKSPITNTQANNLVNGLVLDGKNHKITNIFANDINGGFFDRKLYSSNSITDSVFIIKNVTIEAVLTCFSNINCTLFKFIPGSVNTSASCKIQVEFINIDFKIKFYHRNNSNSKGIIEYYSTPLNNVNFTDCVFNIDIYQTTNVYYIFGDSGYNGASKFIFYYCNFNLNIYTFKECSYSTLLSDSKTYLAHYLMIYYSDIFINIYNNNDTFVNTNRFIFTLNNISSSVMVNSYIVIKNKTDIKAIIRDNFSHNSCFIDSEVLGDNNLYSIANKSGMYHLTTEQCKDPAYLEDIGFIIAKNNKSSNT